MKSGILSFTLVVSLATSACARSEAPAPDTARASVDTLQADTTRNCGIHRTTLLSGQGLGELRPGRAVDEIESLCTILSDREEYGGEGMLERAVVVDAANEMVRLVVDRGRIHRIEINTPAFRTADSLGVDTPLRRIAALRGAQFAPGEDGVYGYGQEHCGLSFRFSLPWRPPRGGQWTAAAISQVHGDATVNRVIVIGCYR